MTDLDPRALLAKQLQAHLKNPEYPLSYPQQRPWFLDQLQKDSCVYNLPMVYRVVGPLDPDRLGRALGEVVRRHEVLRSVFRTVGGVPKQIVLPPHPVPLPTVDLRGRPDREAEARRLAEEEARTAFRLDQGPLIRARALRLAEQEWVLLLTLHHIACDAWSVGIIAREASALYAATAEDREAALPALPLQYVDFTEWQARQVKEADRARLVSYWRDRLAGMPACINLPLDRPRPPVQDYTGSHVSFAIPDDLVREVDALARTRGATPFSVLLAAFAALLSRHTGDDEIVIGTPVANRHLPAVEPLVGFFTNTLVFRPDLAGASGFGDLVSRVGAEAREALAHGDLPFEILVEELRPDRDPAHSPAFQVMCIYWDGDDDAVWSLPGCTVSAAPGDSATAKFDFTLSLTRTGAGIRARLEYATAIFDAATAERMAEGYLTLLRGALAEPEAPLRALPILSGDEARLLASWSDGEPAEPGSLSVHEMIRRQAAQTPGQTAVVDDAGSLTYAELDTRSDELACRLADLGVARGDVVGVFLDRSVHTVTALVGILKAGAAYLPLDPAYPADRLAFMREDSGARVVAARLSLAARAEALGATIVCVDLPGAAVPSRAPVQGSQDDLAYMIYTSGSTGRPKGVRLSHRNVAAFFAAMDRRLGGEQPGTWLAVTSISFDISVLELLWTLTRGFKVVVRAEEPASAASWAEGPAPGEPALVPDFSLFYFGNASRDGSGAEAPYRLVLEGAAFADKNGFKAVWTPERHFHPFGGLFPNPSVLAAAVAARTRTVAVRAGSVVAPLHDPLRIAEEWAVVDNLSGGRAGISFASGWQPDDFVLAPGAYADRKAEMLRRIDEVRRLWRGGTLARVNGAGATIEVGIYPRPVQPELPVWVTSARHPETFRMAGEVGAGLLTHLVGHSVEQLAEKIAIYRSAWREAGWPGEGHAVLMLHTFVHPDLAVVRDTVREPLRAYIRSSFDLMSGFGAAKGVDVTSLPEDELDALLDHAFERFLANSGLLGTPAMAAAAAERLAGIGVDEIGCLIDFGVPEEAVLSALPHLAEARAILLARRAGPGVAAGPEPIAAQIRRHGITHLQCTPSLAGTLAADPEARAALAALRHMLVGGEALPPDLAESLAAAVGGRVHNMYGPTEATVWATASRVEAGAPVRIGAPLAGYRAEVVDALLNPVPVGVPGELLLGGAAVAVGYHARPELTAERFLPDGSGGRRYRTGDVVRWREPGELEFLGRIDNQVKLRGRRIELGEIEAALASHPGVRQAVAEVRGSGDGRGIVAFCVPDGKALPGADALRAHLALSLPEHMIPARFVSLETLPLTPNGKVNRRALPDAAPNEATSDTPFAAPSDALEESIAAAWRAVLGAPRVGVNDNFFELGGNSILAVALRSRLVDGVEPSLTLIDMFRYPTVSALAGSIAARRSAAPPRDGAASLGAEAGGERRAALARRSRARLEGAL